MLLRRWLVAVLVVLFPALLMGQEFRATLTGRVLDPSHAGIPGCAIEVKNVDTNEMTTAATDRAGTYTVPFLRPGRYTITFEAAGFKKLSRQGIRLSVAQTAGVDVTLQIGAISEQVTVTAEAPLLDTQKADRGLVINSQEVQELPLNTRNPFMLSILSPGVNWNGDARYMRPFDLPNSWRINGGLSGQNEFLVDGVPDNAMAGGNQVGWVPAVDAVEEFKLQTNTYDAQYGKTSGGSVNLTLKSGTNDLHGTLYGFTRQSAWAANTFYRNAHSLPRLGEYLWQSGGSVGGPVKIPGLYNGKDRTFFFVSYEDYRQSSGESRFFSVPAPEMIDQPDGTQCPGGIPHCADFSNYRKRDGTLIPIYDPLTVDPVTHLRQPFPGNKIPAGRINPIARNILSYYPKPNNLGDPTQERYSVNDLILDPPAANDTDRFHNLALKLDQSFGSKYHMFVSGGHSNRSEYRVFGAGIYKAPGENAQNPIVRTNWVANVDFVGTLSPTLVFDVRFGYNRNIEGYNDVENTNFSPTNFGFPASMVDQLALPNAFGDYNFDYYGNLGRNWQLVYTNTYTLHPTLTKVFHSHTLKTGIDMRQIVYNQQRPGEHNEFRVNGGLDWTRKQSDRSDSGDSGSAIASFLLGIPSSANADWQVWPSTVGRYLAPYLQDDWKVSRRLTLNLGVRMDFQVSPFERHDRINRGFDATTVNPIDAQINRTAFPQLPPVTGSLQFAGVNGQPRTVSQLDKTTIQPRVGFAYQMLKKMVVRGGYGRYYLNPDNSNIQFNGFDISTSAVTSFDNGLTPATLPGHSAAEPYGGGFLMNNPFPYGIAQPPGSSLGALTFLGKGFSFFDPTFRLPYTDAFSLGFQLELPLHSSLEITYVGQRGHRLETSKSFNEPSLAFRQLCNPLEGGSPSYCNATVPNPFYGLPAFAGTTRGTNPAISRWELARPFPEFGAITQNGRNDGKNWYDSLQFTYLARLKGGLNLSIAYTYSKTTEMTGFIDTQQSILQRSPQADDQPHALKVSTVWQLPIGKGKKWLSGNSFWSRLASGWEHSTIFYWSSGLPQNLPSNVIYQKDATLPDIDWSAPVIRGFRPCVASMNDKGVLTPTGNSLTYGCGTDTSTYNFIYLNFSNNANPPRLTNYRTSALRLQAAPNVDMALNKTTQLTRRTRLQFRLEAFNLLNTHRFPKTQFNTNPTSADFGTIVKANIGDGSTVAFFRQIQLALKLIF